MPTSSGRGSRLPLAGGVRVRFALRQIWSVGRVASWEGYCLPCDRDDRPLVLTRSGASGLLAWLAGIGDDERTLLLTCRVCGQWQVVPLREQDDPEVVLAPVEAAVPQPRRAAAARPVALPVLVPLPLRSAPAESLEARAVPSADAVAAARSVLSAARAGQRTTGQQRTAAPRPAQRSRRAHGRGHRGPTPRRPDHAPTRRPRTVAPVADATSIVLPLELLTSGHSVLLAAG